MNLPPTRERAPSREAPCALLARSCSPRSGDRRRPESRVGPAVLRTGARARANLPPRARWPQTTSLRRNRATCVACLARQRQSPSIPEGAPDGPRPVLASAPDGGHHPVYRFLLPLWGFCSALGQARAWARHAVGPGTRLGRSRVGCSYVAHRNPVAQAAQPGYGGALGGAPRCGAKNDAGSNAQIASAANTVLCSRRLYIVQSGQRRKTGHVKGGND
jgi:hypothetical protein